MKKNMALASVLLAISFASAKAENQHCSVCREVNGYELCRVGDIDEEKMTPAEIKAKKAWFTYDAGPRAKWECKAQDPFPLPSEPIPGSPIMGLPEGDPRGPQ